MKVIAALLSLLRSPNYRWTALLLFFSGSTAYIAAPTFALFASQRLQASELQITTFFAANALVGIFVVMTVGRFSDRVGQRRHYVATGFTWMAIGYLVLATAQHFLVMSLVGVIFFSALEVGNVQLHALSKEIHSDSPSARGLESSLTGSLRAAYVLGCVVGPAVGGALLTLVGNRTVFVTAAVLYVSCAGVALTLLPVASARTKIATQGAPGIAGLLRSERRALLIFGTAVAFSLGGDVLRLALLPVLLSQTLATTPQLANLTFSIAPCLQMVFMPLAGYLADRFGTGKIVTIGSVSGLAYYGLLAFATNIWEVYILQGFYAFLVACIIGVGISHAQKLAKGEAGLATSVYFCAKLIAVVVGSTLSGIVAENYGVRLSFLVPAAMCGIGAVLTLLAIRAEQLHPSPPVVLEATD